MKYLILENDQKLQDNFKKYVETLLDSAIEIVYNANNAKMDKLVKEFSSASVLLFDPTQILFGQYNSLMMLMYSLMKKGELGIKEIHIFHHDEQELVNDLQDLWSEDREYLDHVIKIVKVFIVDQFDKKQIFI